MNISARQMIQKDIVRMTDGHVVSQGIAPLITPQSHDISGFLFKENDQSLFVPWEQVISYENDIIVVSDWQEEPSSGIDLLGLPVFNENGQRFGYIVDFSLTDTGHLDKILLHQRNEASTFHMLSSSYVSIIGEEAIFLSSAMTQDDWLSPDFTLFSDHDCSSTEEHQSDIGFAEFNQLMQKAWKRISKEMPVSELNGWSGKMQEYFTSFMSDVNKRVQELRNKDDHAVQSVYHDLAGKTVKENLYDNKDNVLLTPGQIITEAAIKNVIAADKVFELYRLAINLSDLECQ